MNSTLRQAASDYLELRRALGFKLASVGRLLGQFVDYLDTIGAEEITVEHALAWALLPEQASRHWHAIRLRAVRGFATYLHGIDPSVPVPPVGLIRGGPCRATPYLYADSEIHELIKAAGALTPALRAATYQTLISLLSVTGMRVGEAIALDDEDFDPDRGLLMIRNAKFGKQRLLPLHASSVEALASYVRLRQRSLRRPASRALLLSTRGTRLHHSNIGLTFTSLLAQAGVTRRSPSCKPRAHDLRHSFAVATLSDWYRDGVDVHAMLPRLSTYLGHAEPANTYWYLSASPELMAIVERRLQHNLGSHDE